MKVTSKGILNGVILDIYGKRGKQFNSNGVPSYSLPFTVEDAPAGTVSFAFVLEDKDAYPVTGGFVWMHWLGANLMRSELDDNESQTASDFLQGVNSWSSMQGGKQDPKLSSFYGGMAPPNAPHTYELHVYALDTVLALKNGFFYNDLWKKMEGHILTSATLKGVYRD